MALPIRQREGLSQGTGRRRESDRPPARERALTGALIAGPTVIYLVAGWRRRWVSDDGYITLRVSRQILAGHGPVYNIGERVEASTSTVWAWLLAAVGFLTRAPLPWLAVVLGLLVGAAGLALAIDATRRLVGGSSAQRVVPAGVLVVLALPPVWDFATSGLETGLTLGWIGMSWWLLVRASVRPRGDGHEGSDRPARAYATAAVIGAGELVRPDLAIASAVLLLALLVTIRARGGRLPGLLGLLGAAAAVPVLYELFRMGYYAALVPTPALAKEASAARWGTGAHYLADLVSTYWLLVPLLLLAGSAVADLGRIRARVAETGAGVWLAPPVAGLLSAAYVTRVGGDFMHGRLLLPSLVCVLLPVFVVPVRRVLPTVAVAGVFLWAVVCTLVLRVPYAGGIGPVGIADERGFYAQASGSPHPVTLADYDRSPFFRSTVEAPIDAVVRSGQRTLLFQVNPNPPLAFPLASGVPDHYVFAHYAIGTLGYYAPLDMKIVDRHGLADPMTARLLLGARGRPGHEKSTPASWLAADYVDPASPAALPDAPAYAVVLHQLLERCPALMELSVAIHGRLTLDRFARNILSAPRLTVLRIPEDPEQARSALCG
ncbi:MAG: flagellar motor control protein ZomB [Mycobacteriales bacterium]